MLLPHPPLHCVLGGEVTPTGLGTWKRMKNMAPSRKVAKESLAESEARGRRTHRTGLGQG